MKGIVPRITATGWRVWNLHAVRDARLDDVTRGVLVTLDSEGRVVADGDKHVAAGELGMILEEFRDECLSFHLCFTREVESVGEAVEGLVGRFPLLDGQILQINRRLDSAATDRLLDLKQKHGWTVILQHFNVLPAAPEDRRLELADQVLFDVGGGRGKQRLSLDDRTLARLRTIAGKSTAPIGLAGGLDAAAVIDLVPLMGAVRQAVGDRPLAFDAESGLRADEGLCLERVVHFVESCERALTAAGA